jgi:hypothetical protein
MFFVSGNLTGAELERNAGAAGAGAAGAGAAGAGAAGAGAAGDGAGPSVLDRYVTTGQRRATEATLEFGSDCRVGETDGFDLVDGGGVTGF